MEYNIGEKIRDLRKSKNLTLQKVANETGFSTALISQIENNNVVPPIATLSKLARFFNVKIAHFFQEELDRPYDVVRVENYLDATRSSGKHRTSASSRSSYSSRAVRRCPRCTGSKVPP